MGHARPIMMANMATTTPKKAHLGQKVTAIISHQLLILLKFRGAIVLKLRDLSFALGFTVILMQIANFNLDSG